MATGVISLSLTDFAVDFVLVSALGVGSLLGFAFAVYYIVFAFLATGVILLSLEGFTVDFVFFISDIGVTTTLVLSSVDQKLYQ